MEKEVNKLVYGYEKFTGSDIKVQKTLGDRGNTLCNSELKEPSDKDNYSLFVSQIR